MRLPLTCAALACAAAPMAAQAAEKPPVSLARQGGWEVNYDKDACHLFARFGTGEDETILGLTRYQPGDWTDIGLIGKPVRSRNPQSGIELAFGTQPARWEAGMAGSAGSPARPMMVITGQRLDRWVPRTAEEAEPAITPAQEAAVKSITFRQSGGKPYRLETGSLARPLEGMRACLADLIKSWGYDPAVQAALSRPLKPASNPHMWFRSNDWPMHAAMQRHNGLVQVRMDVDDTGMLTGCNVLRRTNPDEFADVTCEVLRKRARFVPALDAAGKPVKSFYMYKVHWVASDD